MSVDRSGLGVPEEALLPGRKSGWSFLLMLEMWEGYFGVMELEMSCGLKEKRSGGKRIRGWTERLW